METRSLPEGNDSSRRGSWLASLAEVWALLRDVRAVSFVARCETGTGWAGAGVIAVSEPGPWILVLEESGHVRPHGHRDFQFTNVFRWSRLGEVLRLEHLRFGPDHPVFLFDLAPGQDGEWREVSPHVCREDFYSASMRVEAGQLVVRWSIRGPRKQVSIRYVYQNASTVAARVCVA